MYIVNDIKTGFTKVGSYTPSTWTKTKLVASSTGHPRGGIYKNIGVSSGYIEFDYRISENALYTGHCVFKIRSEYLQRGQYYDWDGFYGIALQWYPGKNLFLYENGVYDYNFDQIPILHTFSNYTASETVRIKVLWNTDYIIVQVGNESITLKNKIKKDYTYIDFGFGNYSGEVTRTIKVTSIPSINCEIEKDKLNIVSTSGDYTVNSIDILYNNVIIKTIPYTDNYVHTIEKDKLSIGKNKLSVRINSNFIIPIIKTIEFDNNISLLESNATLTDITDCIKSITSTNEVEYETLKSILINKNINISKEDKMIEVINKVEKLPSIEAISELQTSQRQIENKISILESENKELREELTQIQTSIDSLTSLIVTTLEEK